MMSVEETKRIRNSFPSLSLSVTFVSSCHCYIPHIYIQRNTVHTHIQREREIGTTATTTTVAAVASLHSDLFGQNQRPLCSQEKCCR